MIQQLLTRPPYAAIATIHSVFDAMQVLRQTCNSLGFRYFSVLAVPPLALEQSVSLSRLAILLSWPRELIAEYDRLDLIKTSPILDQLRRQITPLIWDLAAVAEASRGPLFETVRAMFQQYGVTSGIYCPVPDGKGSLHAVSFIGDREALDADEIATLALFSSLVVERLASVSLTASASTSALSPREVEVLKWTAEGNTSNDIARITGLSEHTVNHYAALATQKLGCTNRTQAVVHAIRMGLFS
ncbi:LuxR family transcriptional regulator [Hoeflea marina]|uniref:LuxR family transcriptional regulator n=1 Tax=Hoeflea marina TaxID=274592 RepID=A0A317PFV0_9HYPH|nr:LuxR family transcriptional regulator [Hoeflea marina]PWV97674.1 LuxR family transcriptional regulator [Hoeflea marina]